jgi:dienelactone hydrolase
MSQAVKAPDRSGEFLAFVQNEARAMRANDVPPKSLEAWKVQRQQLRRQLILSWGGFPQEVCPLKPRVVGELKRDGYRVQKLTLQTRPGVLMTANAYVPDGTGRRPAVLCVHGHWRLAKQEPVVQSRCIGLAKLGFFVLMVDAFGAGERGIGRALGEYHGEMVAATLWPSGLALAGLQVHDNMRAVDYLQSRPEVDAKRIGVTGASGGGNQTMYVGAIDERLKCVVPVCSVGTYQAYLGAACCMCEVTPAALSYTEEAGVLSLVAPRGLMLVNATRDSFVFSVGEAKKSLAAARRVFRLYGKEDQARHAIFESKHDYNRPMREAMYGWMTRHLKGEGDGSPIAEPKIEVEEPELLRCFPGEIRPDSFVTLPLFAAAEARRILKRRPIPDHIEQWQTDEMVMRGSLERVLGGLPKRTPLGAKVTAAETGADLTIEFAPEPGITLTARRRAAQGKRRGLALLLDLDLGRKAGDSKLAAALYGGGWDVVTTDLRATGVTAYGRDKIGRAPDHNTAEWAMWIGRPLLGQWVWDVKRLIDVLAEHVGGLPKPTAVIGVGPAGLVALSAAALDERFDRIVTAGSLAGYVSQTPYEKQRLGIMVPGILRDVGDVSHLAALAAPRRLIIAGGVTGAGQALSLAALKKNYAYTRAAFQLERAAAALRFAESDQPGSIVKALA